MTDTMPSTDSPGVPLGVPRTKAPEPVLSTKAMTGERYWSREFMELEWERLWTRTWLIVGREDQFREAGEYVTQEIGRESVLVVRGSDGRLRAFYNVCQHRGNRLVNAEVGALHGGQFSCAYHGWRFADTGTLTWAYDEDDFAGGSPCGNVNLEEIPCDTWGGFVWINFDPACVGLREYLHPVADHLDCYRMEDMKRTHWITLEGDFNWKCMQDNFNESYHLPFVHPQLSFTLNEHHSGCQFDMYESGHVRMLMPGGGPGPHFTGRVDRVLDGMRETLTFWELDPEQFRDDPAAIRAALQKRKRELGEAKGFDFSRYTDEQLTDNYHYTIFPNVSFSMKPDGCIVLFAFPHATDPEKCFFQMWYLTLFPEGAKQYYSASMRDWVDVDARIPHQSGKAGEVSCGPTIDQDVAIWNTQQAGLRSRGFRGAHLPKQEYRIRYFHDNLDTWLGLA
jgi:phenylpropionate dioxygenase-like ring-hydroxylating dioxygenase large terminal subunit